MPDTVQDLIRKAAQTHGIPAELALAVAEQESGFNPTLTGPEITEGSAKGQRAIGTFQIIPTTGQMLGGDPSDPRQNIDMGAKYLRQLMDQNKGNLEAVLRSYGGVVDDTTYVPQVMGRIQKFKGQPSPPPAAQPAPTLPPGATKGMLPQSTPTTTKETPYRTPAERERQLTKDVVSGVAGGVRAQLAKTVYGGGDVIRRGLGMERIIDRPDVQAAMTAPEGAPGKAGELATEIAEYAIPSTLVTKGTKALGVVQRLIRAGVTPSRARVMAAAVEGVGQGATAAGIKAVHGEDPTAAAIVSAASPVAAQMITEMAPAIRMAAVTRMARFMERGVRGDITPTMERNLAQAANDMIDLPLQRTWRQTARLTRGRRQVASTTLGQALSGPLGDTPVPLQPVIQALDDLATEAQHIIPIGQQGAYRSKEFKPGVQGAVAELKEFLDDYVQAYGNAIPARQLHDIKSVWWKKIYPRKEAANPVGSVSELLTSAQKEAHLRGAAAIAQVMESDAPQIAALDSAVTHASLLDQFVKKLAAKARTSTLARPEARYAIGAAGGAVGMAAGSTLGHGIIGAHVGYGTARLLLNAIESPKWRLLPISQRRRLADALASGNADMVRKIVAPIVSSMGDQELESGSASAAR